MTEHSKPDNLKLAIAAIVMGCFALSLGDALIKQQSTSLVLWQIFLMRSLIAVPLLIYLVRIRSCDTTIMPLQPGWTLLRSFILVTMWVFYFIALPRVELAIAAAAFYTLPIFISLFAAWFLNSKITLSGWLAILLGFAGSLLILQPQADDFNAYALLPIVSAICYAIAMIMTRSKCQQEKPLVLSLWLNFSFILVGAMALIILYFWQPQAQLVNVNPFLLASWTSMGLDEWRALAILAVAIVIGSAGAAYAYQAGPSPVIASFDFSYVAFAALWGLVFFAEVPESETLLGVALIVSGGLLALRPAVGPA